MQCRHCLAPWDVAWEYCPECQRNYGGAVYPETQTLEELADVERIVLLIEKAFHDVQLLDGMTIHEADLEGVYLEPNAVTVARSKDPETRWQDIPDWKLERLHPHSFFDVKGWHFHIPAYMRWTLRHWRISNSVTIDWTIYSLDLSMETIDIPRYEILSLEQSRAVYEFLLFFRNYSPDPDGSMAITHYWRKFAPESPE